MKNKSTQCSTGHGTGVLMPVTISPRRRLRTRTPKKNAMLRGYAEAFMKKEEERQQAMRLAQESWAKKQEAENRGLLKEGWRRAKGWLNRKMRPRRKV
jgi:hypothetical protein